MFEQAGRLNDINGVDGLNPKQACKVGSGELFRFVEETEQLIRSFLIQAFPFHAVDMGKDEIDILLGETVEGSTLRNDIPEEGVVLFHSGFLGRTVGITEEKLCLPGTVRRIHKGMDIGELAAVVRQDQREKRTE